MQIDNQVKIKKIDRWRSAKACDTNTNKLVSWALTATLSLLTFFPILTSYTSVAGTFWQHCNRKERFHNRSNSFFPHNVLNSIISIIMLLLKDFSYFSKLSRKWLKFLCSTHTRLTSMSRRFLLCLITSRTSSDDKNYWVFSCPAIKDLALKLFDILKNSILIKKRKEK